MIATNCVANWTYVVSNIIMAFHLLSYPLPFGGIERPNYTILDSYYYSSYY